MKNRKVAIVTGPTGGHFFPGLAIGEQLKNKNIDVCFFVPKRNYIIEWLKRKGFDYKTVGEVHLTLRYPLSFIKFIYLLFCSFYTLIKGRYQIVVITGSYVTFPFLLAGFLCNRKIFIHEQNVIPGKITKISNFIADRIGISFPETHRYLNKKIITVTGFPLPEDFKKQYHKDALFKEFGFSPNKITLLILGGSQGSVFINSLIIDNIEYLTKKDIQFIHLAGREKEKVSAEYKKYGVKARVFDFYFDMAKLYSITDVLICRGGAGTIAEICYWKIPSIIIPYPYAGGHQKYNALYLAKKECCYIIEEKEYSKSLFTETFEKILENIDNIKQRISMLSIVDNEYKTLSAIMDLVKK